MKAGTRLLLSLCLCAGVTGLAATLTMQTSQAAPRAVVQTDLRDYAPYSQVNVTGSGWLAGEVVELTITETETTPPGGYTDGPFIFYATADSLGNIINGDFYTDQHDVGVHFLLTAKGTISGRTAQATFTDNLPGLFEIEGNSKLDVPSSHDWNQVYADYLVRIGQATGTGLASGTGSIQFTSDGVATAQDDAFSNSPKDVDDVSTWKWTRKAVSSPKTDLEHGFAAAYLESGYPDYGGTHTLLFVGTDRYASGSNSAISMWFLQNPIGMKTDGTFCERTGLVCKPADVAETHTVGDLLIQAALGSSPIVTAYKWVGGKNPLQPLSLDPGTQYTQAINDRTITVPWSFINASGASTPMAQEFFEVGLDLNRVFGAVNADLPDFSSFIITTRTSNSQTATLSDFILGNLSTVPDIAVAKTADRPNVSGKTFAAYAANEQVGYYVTVSNVGVGDITGATLNDPLPTGAAGDLSWSLAGDSTPGKFQISGNVLSFVSPQTLPNNSAPLVAHVVATPSTADIGKLHNVATVAAVGETENFHFNNSAEADIVIVPVAAADTYTISLNGTLVVAAPGVLSNDGTPLTGINAVLVTSPTHGSLTVALAADGSFTYKPTTGYFGQDSFTYKAVDAYGNSSNEATVTINIGNKAPVAVDNSYDVDEDGTLTMPASGVLSNDTDGDGNTLTVASPLAITGVSHGTLTLNADGSFVYKPSKDYHGTDSFTYQATDGAANSNTATVTITVHPVNDAPVAIDDATSTDEDTPKILTQAYLKGNDTDIDNTNAQLSVTAVSGAVNGTVVLNGDGTVTFTPADNFHGTAGFDYTLSDGALTDTGHVTVTVNAVNDAPANVIVNDATLDENSVYALSGSFTDLEAVDGDTHTVTISWGDGTSNTVINNGSALTFTASHQYLDDKPAGPDTYAVTVTVRDSSGAEGVGAATVTVNNVAPVIAMSAGTIAISLGDTFARPGSFSDVGTVDTWSATIDYGDGNGEQVLALTPEKTFSLTSPAYTAGTHTVIVKVTDDDGGVATKSFQVLVESTLECLVPQIP